MVIPLHDDNPSATRPVVTVTLMLLCILVYVLQHLWAGEAAAAAAIHHFGVIPAAVTGHEALRVEPQAIPSWATLLSYQFVHGGFWHLAGNLLYLWIFGNNVEDAMGHGRFAAFYLLCGIGAVGAQVLPNPGSVTPMVGASGAISGVLGAYMLLFPRARVLLGVPIGFVLVQLGRYPAIWVLATWFLLQLIMDAINAVMSARLGELQGGVAFGAHIGGFLAGVVLVTVFKKRDVPLWRRH